MSAEDAYADDYDMLLGDEVIKHLDTTRGRLSLMVVTTLSIIYTGVHATLTTTAAPTLIIWTLIALANLATVYTLTTYRKPYHLIEADILND